MTPDPRDPATWPTVPPTSDGWYLAETPTIGGPNLIQPWLIRDGKVLVAHASGQLQLNATLALFQGWRWYPVPITPANLRAGETP